MQLIRTFSCSCGRVDNPQKRRRKTVAVFPSDIRNYSRPDPLDLSQPVTGNEVPAFAHPWLIAVGKPHWAVGVATSLRVLVSIQMFLKFPAPKPFKIFATPVYKSLLRQKIFSSYLQYLYFIVPKFQEVYCILFPQNFNRMFKCTRCTRSSTLLQPFLKCKKLLHVDSACNQ